MHAEVVSIRLLCNCASVLFEMLLQDLREREDRTELEDRTVMKITTLMHSILSVQGFGAWKKILMDMCHEIFQNSSNGNCHQIEWNVKKSLKTLIKPGWTDLKTIQRDVNCGLSKPNSVFQSSILFFVMFGLMLERHACFVWHDAMILLFTCTSTVVSSLTLSSIVKNKWQY